METKVKKEKAKFSLDKWKSVFSHLKHLKKRIYFLLIMTLIVVLIDIAFPLLQAYIIDNFIKKETVKGIWIFSAFYLLLLFINTFIMMCFFGWGIKLEMLMLKTLRNKVFSKIQTLPVSYFNNRSVGYLVAKTMSDTERIGATFAWSAIDIFWPILFIIGMFIPMFIVKWQIAAVIFLLVPIALLLSIFFEKKLLSQNREIRRINSAISGALNEGITGAKTIKTLNIEEKMSDEFRNKTTQMCRKTFKYNRVLGFYVSLIVFLSSFALATVITLGGNEHILFVDTMEKYGISLGEFSMFLSFTFSIIDPIMRLAESLTGLVANQANVERTLRVLEEEPKITDAPEIIEKYGDAFNPKYENWEPLYGDIEFENVSFKYDDDDKYILKNFSIKIPKGSSLALVGETGAGKSTIVNLLCRFYEPTEGRILIDGKDYKERSQFWLAKNLGYVLQMPHLFSGTVRENIKYADQNGSDERMIEAARIVSADKIVSKLEKGYDTETGECGDTLSAGEKQLLTFARAIYADPKIVILDEATSNIDTETEHVIQQAISKILKGRTSIMVAHRLSTIKNSDMILLIENGEIAEKGNHTKLMAEKGKYYKLYTKMFELESMSKILELSDPNREQWQSQSTKAQIYDEFD